MLNKKEVMEDHILVCPFQENILSEFSGKRIVVRTEEISSLPGIFRYFDKSSNRLYAIMLNIDEPFANIDFEEAGKDIGYPVHIFAPEMGDFKVLYQKLPLLRSIPIKVFLSSDNDENYTSLKILASLGIQCGI